MIAFGDFMKSNYILNYGIYYELITESNSWVSVHVYSEEDSGMEETVRGPRREVTFCVLFR